MTLSRISYPAKMSRALLRRIFFYLFDHGYLERGGVVVDPFGGIFTTGLEAASRGVRAYGCELEEKFCKLAAKNIDLHRRTWEACGNPLPVLVQGDSRQLCSVLGPVMASVVVGSPPYTEEVVHGRPSKMTQGIFKWRKANTGLGGYGTTTGQLGSMKPGTVDAAIGADCVVGSPPFCSGDSASAQSITTRNDKSAEWVKKNCGSAATQGYGTTPGNIANMPSGTLSDAIAPQPEASVIVSSPPCENQEPSHAQGSEKFKAKHRELHPSKWCKDRAFVDAEYGNSAGQLGNTTGGTFWEAFREILLQCHQILKPNGIMVLVTKDFVRNKKRVEFSADTVRLCIACGFELVEWIKASLTTHKDVKTANGYVRTKSSRKSFFRRLSERRAAANKLWDELCKDIKARHTAFARSQAEDSFDRLPIEDVVSRHGIHFNREKIIARQAKMDAPMLALAEWESNGGSVDKMNEHVRIDFEDVLVMRKTR